MTSQLILRSFNIPLVRPIRTAAGPIHSRRGIAIRVRDDRGVGVGEATPLPGWTESYADCHAALSSIAVHGDPFCQAWEEVLKTTPAARHGLSLAIADHRARRGGTPLYRYLGGVEDTEFVPVNCTIGDADVSRTVETAVSAIDNGFETIKLKVGVRSVAEDAERLRQVRDAVGPTIELRADANGAWSNTQAHRAFAEFETLDVSFVEQPLARDELDNLESLRDWSVDVALDETLIGRSVDEIDELFSVASVVVLKPMVIGGIDRTVEVARRARSAGVTPVITTTIDGTIARTAAGHAAATIPNPRACGLATAALLVSDIGIDPAPVENGRIRIPTGDGVCVDWPWESVRTGDVR